MLDVVSYPVRTAYYMLLLCRQLGFLVVFRSLIVIGPTGLFNFKD